MRVSPDDKKIKEEEDKVIFNADDDNENENEDDSDDSDTACDDSDSSSDNENVEIERCILPSEIQENHGPFANQPQPTVAGKVSRIAISLPCPSFIY